MKREDKHVIWTSDIDLDDYKEWLDEEYPNASETRRWELAEERNADMLEIERENLDIQLDDDIIVIADLGRWHGRVPGYKIIPSGNIKACLYSDADFNTWYVDNRGDLRCDASHHDGTNYYTYRVWRPGVSEIQKENFLDKIYYGKATRRDVTRVTRRLGDDIASVYGWQTYRM